MNGVPNFGLFSLTLYSIRNVLTLIFELKHSSWQRNQKFTLLNLRNASVWMYKWVHSMMKWYLDLKLVLISPVDSIERTFFKRLRFRVGISYIRSISNRITTKFQFRCQTSLILINSMSFEEKVVLITVVSVLVLNISQMRRCWSKTARYDLFTKQFTKYQSNYE